MPGAVAPHSPPNIRASSGEGREWRRSRMLRKLELEPQHLLRRAFSTGAPVTSLGGLRSHKVQTRRKSCGADESQKIAIANPNTHILHSCAFIHACLCIYVFIDTTHRYTPASTFSYSGRCVLSLPAPVSKLAIQAHFAWWLALLVGSPGSGILVSPSRGNADAFTRVGAGSGFFLDF